MKIIASDFDGTLNYGGIGPEKQQAIACWRKAGNLFGLISGRSPGDLLKLTEEFHVECDFLLADSGATIAKPDGTVISDVRCPGHVAKPLVSLLMTQGSRFCGVRSTRVYSLRPEKDACSPGELAFQEMPEVPWFTQINTQQRSAREAEQVVALVKQEFGNFVNPLQNEEWIDIVPAGMNKAKGLYRLLTYLNADAGDLITVGDNLNDADMIAEFYSYAVENAVPRIKELSDHVVPGVTELIEREMKYG